MNLSLCSTVLVNFTFLSNSVSTARVPIKSEQRGLKLVSIMMIIFRDDLGAFRSLRHNCLIVLKIVTRIRMRIPTSLTSRPLHT